MLWFAHLEGNWDRVFGGFGIKKKIQKALKSLAGNPGDAVCSRVIPLGSFPFPQRGSGFGMWEDVGKEGMGR